MISVVVPVRDGETFVHDCWQTVCQQSQLPSEVVFVDDGSTDGTLEALHRLKSSALQLKVLSQANRGPAAARNAGIREARGELIAMLDIDDTWPRKKLERALQCFAEQPKLDVVGGLVQLQWAPGEQPRNLALVLPHRRVNLGAYVFRARVFDWVGPLDPELRFGEDVDYLCRLRQFGASFLELDEVTLHYRQHGSNMTRGRSARQLGLFQALNKSLQRGRLPR